MKTILTFLIGCAVGLLLMVGALFLFKGFLPDSQASSRNQAVANFVLDKNFIVGSINGKEYTMEELQPGLYQSYAMDLYYIMNFNLKQVYLSTLKDRKTEKDFPTSDQEALDFYKRDEGYQKSGSFEKIKKALREDLTKQKLFAYESQLVEEAVKRGEVKFSVMPSPGFSTNNENAILRQQGTGRVTVVEFSDYQCPFCRGFHPTIVRLAKEFPQVSFYFRHFPLETIHPNAFHLANVAACADAEGMFNQVDDWLFQHQENYSDEALLAYADGVKQGSRQNLQKCIQAQTYKDKIRGDLKEGVQLGIQGTPSFLIGWTAPNSKNFLGELFQGNQPYEDVKASIERYLSTNPDDYPL